MPFKQEHAEHMLKAGYSVEPAGNGGFVVRVQGLSGWQAPVAGAFSTGPALIQALHLLHYPRPSPDEAASCVATTSSRPPTDVVAPLFETMRDFLTFTEKDGARVAVANCMTLAPHDTLVRAEVDLLVCYGWAEYVPAESPLPAGWIQARLTAAGLNIALRAGEGAGEEGLRVANYGKSVPAT